VQTNNTKELGAFRNPPHVHTFKFWHEQDVGTLYKLHNRICARLNSGRRILTLYDKFDGDVESYMNECVLAEPCQYQVEIGLLRRIPSGFAATFKGAFILTWQELWPMKSIRQSRELRKARRWLDELGKAVDRRL